MYSPLAIYSAIYTHSAIIIVAFFKKCVNLKMFKQKFQISLDEYHFLASVDGGNRSTRK